MKLHNVLRALWYTTDHVTRVLNLIFFVLLAGTLLLAWFFGSNSPGNIYGIGGLIAITSAILWYLSGPRLLLLHRNMHALRVPHASLTVLSTLAVAMALTTALPATVLVLLLGGNWLHWFLISTLFASMTLLWTFLAGWLSLTIPLLLVVGVTFGTQIGWPGLGDPGFVSFAAKWIMLAAVALAWRWQQLLNMDPASYSKNSRPVVFALRAAYGEESLSISNMKIGLGLPQTRPRLTGLGPEQPVATLRVWLGGLFTPRTLSLRLIGWLLPVLGLAALVLVLVSRAQHWNATALTSLVWIVFTGIILYPLLVTKQLSTLYTQSSNGEIAELALLPGLGNAAKHRSLLLRATIGHIAQQIILGTLLMLGTAELLAAPVFFLVAILLTGLGMIGVCATVILAILAGQFVEVTSSWHLLTRAMLVILSIALLFLTLVYGLQSAIFSVETGLLLLWTLAVCWSLFFLINTTLVRRYWHTFQHRPHPFLLH